MISCALISPTINNSKAARVIFPGGEIRQFREPAMAAEPMLERPGFFLVNSRSLTVGRRFSPLSADEDLEFGHLYVMFPMRRVNSVVTAADVAVIFMASKSPAKRISGVGNGRVTPESGQTLTVDRSPEDGGGGLRLSLGDGEGFPAPEFKYRLAVCRSRKPGLDTITEEPLCSR
ncbi:uncharacterized protein LOC130791276 [Actinidia eriantha]|uniref:uncharacterized protein LOC130791276 n=1 Tax=Actinidia eriantha TaxID=165200 RepID=UPI0025857E45|nr:uncharacterized protein LOC130791276 [Actinidia eriantha]